MHPEGMDHVVSVERLEESVHVTSVAHLEEVADVVRVGHPQGCRRHGGRAVAGTTIAATGLSLPLEIGSSGE